MLSDEVFGTLVDRMEKAGSVESGLVAEDVNPVAVSVGNSVTQNLTTAASPQILQWNTTNFDTFGTMDLTNNYWVAPFGGIYRVSAMCGIDPHASSASWMWQSIGVYVNATLRAYLARTRHLGANQVDTLGNSVLIELDEDDTVALWFDMTGSITLVRTADIQQNWMTIHRVRG
jgi:hypothetical protein